MALYKLLCGVTVMILLTANGCHAIMPECGREREGQDLDERLPWHVIVSPSLCIGNLISPLYVLTEGSCEVNVASILALGRLNLNTYTFEEQKMAANVTCSPTSMGGLCLVKLDSPVTFTDAIYPICVASSDSVFQSGMDSQVTTSHVLDRTSVPIVGDTECDCFLPERPMSTVCAGRNEQRTKSMGDCVVNIGGALMAKSEDHWTMIGVVNPDPNCTDIRSLRSYTAVASFAEWIAEVTRTSEPDFVTFKPSGTEPDTNFVCPTATPPEPPHTPTSSHPNTSQPPHPPTSSHPNTSRPPHPPTSSHPNTSRPPHPPTSSHPNTSRPPHPPTSSHPNTSRPPHPATSSHSNTSRPPHPPTSSHPNTSQPPHPPTSSHPNTSRPPHPPTSSHPNTSQPPDPPTSSHPNTSRPPHPPTCIHPTPHPTRPCPCFLDPGSDDCRNDFESVFGNGVAIHSSPFILLCVLVLSFFGMNW